jgi:transcriptional regulator with XRE-family HTH domain
VIGERVKRLRKNKGLNQSELAVDLSLTRRMISGIESGETNPTLKQIELFSRYFNVTSDYLIFGVDDIKPAERDILKAVRDDRSIYDAIQRVIASKKHLEGMAA